MERHVKPARDAAAPPDAARAPQPRGEPLLLSLYRTMRRIRTFEERVGELFVRGQTAGSMLHLSIGEEAAAAGVCHAMRAAGHLHHPPPRPRHLPGPRGRPEADDGRDRRQGPTGYCRGKGGSMHIADMALGHLGANAIVGGGIPAVVGAGAQLPGTSRTDAISVAFFGDGAMQQGILYESMNMAGALGPAGASSSASTTSTAWARGSTRRRSHTRFDERASAFGLNGAMVDGVDVEAVRRGGRADRRRRPRGRRPGFLAVDCYRFFGHARMDKSPYRSRGGGGARAASATRWPARADAAARAGAAGGGRPGRARRRRRRRDGRHHRLRHPAASCRRSTPCSATSTPTASPRPSPLATRLARMLLGGGS